MMDFCLVILDASMSASDDHNILKAMRASKTMPILVLSSHADHTERIHAFNAGAHAYMGKPYTDEECLAQAHTLMQLYVDMLPESKLCYTLAFGNDLVINPEGRTWIEMELVRQTVIAIEQMKKNGDCIAEGELGVRSPFPYAEDGNENH